MYTYTLQHTSIASSESMWSILGVSSEDEDGLRRMASPVHHSEAVKVSREGNRMSHRKRVHRTTEQPTPTNNMAG